MKNLLTFCILILILQVILYPQDARTKYKLPGYSLLEEEELLSHKISGSKGLLNIPAPPARRIQKNNSFEQNGSMFKPVKILVDTIRRYTYDYDNNGNQTSELLENYKDGSLEMYSKTVSSYDDKNNLINALHLFWNNGQWDNVDRTIYTYDKYDNQLDFLEQYWENGDWHNYYKEVFTYDENGNQLTRLDVYWPYKGGADSIRHTFTYDNNNNIRTYVYENQSNGLWTKAFRMTYTYDNYGNMLTNLYEEWKDNAWIPNQKYTSTYDDHDNFLTSVCEVFIDGKWVFSFSQSSTYDNKGNRLTYLDDGFSKNYFTYDSNGNLTAELLQYNLSGSFTDRMKSVYTYDDHGNAIKGEAFEKRDNAWAPSSNGLNMYYNNRKDKISFTGKTVEIEYEAVGSREPAAVQVFDLMQNYPNPFNSSTTIRYSIKKEGRVKITVFDILGNRVAVPVDKYKPEGSYYVKFDGSSLPSGVYIYMLESGGSITTKKLILMK